MKLRSVAVGVMLLGACGVSAWAVPLSFSNTVNFDAGSDGVADHLGRTAIELSGTGTALFTYDYTHSVAFVPAAGSILGATVTLTHNGNRNSAAEVWLLLGVTNTEIQIGMLSDSQGNSTNSWLDDTFTIPLALYPSLPAGTWTLQLRLGETSLNGGGDQNDELWIDKSVLEGTYAAPVPEPGTLALLGLGLTGLAARRRPTRSRRL